MMGRVARSLSLALAVALAIFAAAMPVSAQDDRFAGSFLTPFPASDTYQVLIIGDSFAEGLYGPLVDLLASDKRISFERRMFWLGGIGKADFADRLREIDDRLSGEGITIAVLMVGEDDRAPIRLDKGQRLAPESQEWRQEYSRRLDQLGKLLRRRGVAAYWVGLPIMARQDVDEVVQAMNDIIREKSYLSGHKYIDAHAGFTDENGGYSAYGPDITGKIRALRSGNGTYFTGAGNRKLAHFVEKELRRDVKQARSERAVPLAGDSGEQARINPAVTAAETSSAADGSAKKTVEASGERAAAAASSTSLFSSLSASPSAASSSTSRTTNADLGNETSVVSVKASTSNGVQQAFTAEIVRPPVPGSVIAAMTRRENAQRATQLGDLVIDQISGGLTIMSSITPPQGGGERAKLSPTQSPSFRLLVKGERLLSKPGRADDFTWTPPVTSGP